jgi:hypothetical protein
MVQFCAVRAKDAKTYREHQAELMAALNGRVGDFSWYAERISPYPLLCDAADLQRFSRLRFVLHQALLDLVNAYDTDERLSAIIRLSPPHRALLARAQRRPYEVGSFRPDLLLDGNGMWRVCEINARFPVNGYMSSYYIHQATASMVTLYNRLARPLSGQDAILEAIADRFDAAKPIRILRDKEKGMDTHLLVPALRRRGMWVEVCPPSALAVRDEVIYHGDTAVEQFILELERDELLAMDAGLFDALSACPSYFNDLRTLLLVHDKRMLAVLSDAGIMADYIHNAADRELLAQHILPTYTADDPRIAGELRREPHNWVLKRNSSGRGIGMLIGPECDPGEWRRVLDQEADDYTAQRYLAQQMLDVITLENGELVEKPMQVVGMLPGFDAALYGPGFFRAGPPGIVNVHGGLGEIIPAMALATAITA